MKEKLKKAISLFMAATVTLATIHIAGNSLKVSAATTTGNTNTFTVNTPGSYRFTDTTTNIFPMSSENGGDGSNSVHLAWAEPGGRSWDVLRGVTGDAPNTTVPSSYGKDINVLNIYPNKNASSDVANGKVLQIWLNALANSPTATQEDKDIVSRIHVTSLPVNNFNGVNSLSSMESKLFTDVASKTSKYDAIFMGAADANNYVYPSANGLKALQEYVDAGYGILFGHDTLAYHSTSETNLYKQFASQLGMTSYMETPTLNQINSKYPSHKITKSSNWRNVSVSSYGPNNNKSTSTVNVVKNGYLTNYPFAIPLGNLQVPFTHSLGQFVNDSEDWIKFSNMSATTHTSGLNEMFVTVNNEVKTNNYYLVARKNIAMTQTGHTTAAPTKDETRVIINLLYSLNQKSSTAEITDNTVSDNAAPDVQAFDKNNNVTIDSVNNLIKIKVFAQDQGTEYQYKVNSKTSGKDSDTIAGTITSGLRGFAVGVNAAPDLSNLYKTPTGEARINDIVLDTSKNGVLTDNSTNNALLLTKGQATGNEIVDTNNKRISSNRDYIGSVTYTIPLNDVLSGKINTIQVAAIDYANNVSKPMTINLNQLRKVQARAVYADDGSVIDPSLNLSTTSLASGSIIYGIVGSSVNVSAPASTLLVPSVGEPSQKTVIIPAVPVNDATNNGVVYTDFKYQTPLIKMNYYDIVSKSKVYPSGSKSGHYNTPPIVSPLTTSNFYTYQYAIITNIDGTSTKVTGNSFTLDYKKNKSIDFYYQKDSTKVVLNMLDMNNNAALIPAVTDTKDEAGNDLKSGDSYTHNPLVVSGYVFDHATTSESATPITDLSQCTINQLSKLNIGNTINYYYKPVDSSVGDVGVNHYYHDSNGRNQIIDSYVISGSSYTPQITSGSALTFKNTTPTTNVSFYSYNLNKDAKVYPALNGITSPKYDGFGPLSFDDKFKSTNFSNLTNVNLTGGPNVTTAAYIADLVLTDNATPNNVYTHDIISQWKMGIKNINIIIAGIDKDQTGKKPVNLYQPDAAQNPSYINRNLGAPFNFSPLLFGSSANPNNLSVNTSLTVPTYNPYKYEFDHWLYVKQADATKFMNNVNVDITTLAQALDVSDSSDYTLNVGDGFPDAVTSTDVLSIYKEKTPSAVTIHLLDTDGNDIIPDENMEAHTNKYFDTNSTTPSIQNTDLLYPGQPISVDYDTLLAKMNLFGSAANMTPDDVNLIKYGYTIDNVANKTQSIAALVAGDNVINFTLVPVITPGAVTINYLDSTNGNAVLESDTLPDQIGSSYTCPTPKQFAGYTYASADANRAPDDMFRLSNTITNNVINYYYTKDIVPSVVSISPELKNITSGGTQTVTITGTNLSTTNVALDYLGTKIYPVSANGSTATFSVAVPNVTNTHTFHAYCGKTDLVETSLVSKFNVTIPSPFPLVQSISPVTKNLTSGGLQEVTVTGADLTMSNIALYYNGENLNITPLVINGTTAIFEVDIPNVNGTYPINLYAGDNGLIDSKLTSTFTVNISTTAPNITNVDVNPNEVGAAGGLVSVVVSGTDLTVQNVMLTVESEFGYIISPSNISQPVEKNGDIVFNVFLPKNTSTADIGYLFVASAGSSMDFANGTVSYEVNVPLPTITSVSPVTKNLSSGGLQTVTITGTNLTESDVILKINGIDTSLIPTIINGTTAIFDVEIPNVNGTYTYNVFDGITSLVDTGLSSTFNVSIVATAPDIINVSASPSVHDSTGGDSTITVTGTNLTTNMTLEVEGSDGTFLPASSITGPFDHNGVITFIVNFPSDLGKDIDYKCTAQEGSSMGTDFVTVHGVTNLPVPTVTSISPVQKNLGNGGMQTIVVTGTNLSQTNVALEYSTLASVRKLAGTKATKKLGALLGTNGSITNNGTTATFTVNVPDIDGTYVYTAVCGNDIMIDTGLASTFTVTKSPTNPLITSVLPNPTTLANSGGTVTVTVTGNFLVASNITLSCTDDEGNVLPSSNISAGVMNGNDVIFTVTLPNNLGLTDITYTFLASEVTEGSEADANVVVAFDQVLLEPTITAITPINTRISSGGTQEIVVTGTNFKESNVALFENGVDLGVTPMIINGTTAIFLVEIPDVNGTYIYNAYCGDATLKDSGLSSTFVEVQDPKLPNILNVSPSPSELGYEGGPTTITVNGNNLTETNVILYIIDAKGNVLPASEIGSAVNDNGEISFVVTLPENTGDDLIYTVIAKADPSQGYTSEGVTEVMVASKGIAPKIERITSISASPSTLGCIGGNTLITVTGVNLTESSVLIKFNGRLVIPTNFTGTTATATVAVPPNGTNNEIIMNAEALLNGVATGVNTNVHILKYTDNSGGGDNSNNGGGDNSSKPTPKPTAIPVAPTPSAVPVPSVEPSATANISPKVEANINGKTIILDTTSNTPYIHGYTDGSVRPNDSVTRAEVAAIFFKLIENQDKNSAIDSKFSDVDGSLWYAQAISYLTSVGLLKGYDDGTFRPDQVITRAEYASILAKFKELNVPDEVAFTDITNNAWYSKAVSDVHQQGWMRGYPDGSFKPNKDITRAEVTVCMNKVLNRKPITDTTVVTKFTDLVSSNWAYADIVEASRD